MGFKQKLGVAARSYVFVESHQINRKRGHRYRTSNDDDMTRR